MIPAGLDATIVLVRHGESEYIVEGRFQGQADTPLSLAGRRQAELVGRRLARPHEPPALPVPVGPPGEIVHSPLARAGQTAAAIATSFGEAPGGPTVRPDPGFLEIGQGAWEGLHRDEVAARYPDELAAWRRDPTAGWAPGGESLAEVAERVGAALDALLGALGSAGRPQTTERDHVAGYGTDRLEHPWSIVVAHDGVFKVALLTIFGLSLERFWMWSMDLCAITIVEFRAGRAILRAHNLTAHLAAVLDEPAVAEQEERSRSGAL